MIWAKYKLLLGGSITIVILLTAMYVQYLRHENQTLKAERDTLKANYAQLISVREAERTVSHEYQSKNAALQSQLRNANRVRKCVPVRMPENTPGHSSPATGTELSGGNGLESGYLIDFAGRCESVRLKLLSCQALCG
jgi:hypothetical protein